MNVPLPSRLEPATPPEGQRFLLAGEESRGLLLALLLAVTVVRIVGLAVSNAELYYDEAQYWVWAQDPAFGYYTKPPLIAWLIASTTSVCGDSPFCVRLPSPILHFAISLVIYAIAEKLHSRRVAFWAALVYALMPGTSISSILMSTDVPLLLFWSLALLALIYHVEKPSLKTGLALGLAIGLGINAKYAMLFFFAGWALYVINSRRALAGLKHPGTWLALAVTLLLVAPNLAWNADHQFATFEHTRENAGWNGKFPNILGLLAFIGTQIAIIGPVPFAAFVYAFFRRPEGFKPEARRLLISISLSVFALISAQALISKANGNWAATGFPAAVVLAATTMVVMRWRRGMVVTMIISAVALVGITFSGLLAGTITSGPIGKELGKMVGWGDLAAKIRQLAEAQGVKTVVVTSRGLTASMIYELRGSGLDVRSYVTDPGHPTDHFEMTRPWSPTDKGPVLMVYVGTWPPPAEIAKRAKLVEQFHTDVFLARGYDWTASAYRLD